MKATNDLRHNNQLKRAGPEVEGMGGGKGGWKREGGGREEGGKWSPESGQIQGNISQGGMPG